MRTSVARPISQLKRRCPLARNSGKVHLKIHAARPILLYSCSRPINPLMENELRPTLKNAAATAILDHSWGKAHLINSCRLAQWTMIRDATLPARGPDQPNSSKTRKWPTTSNWVTSHLLTRHGPGRRAINRQIRYELVQYEPAQFSIHGRGPSSHTAQ